MQLYKKRKPAAGISGHDTYEKHHKRTQTKYNTLERKRKGVILWKHCYQLAK